MKPKKRKLLDLLMLFLLLSGIGILAYPFVSDALNNYLDQQIISHYQQQAVKENEEVMAKIQENMTKKNQQLAKEGGNPGIEINGQTLAYQVDQIKTVEPTDTKDLRIEKGKDFVTLLTCTPYMINSHRLLVRGHRVPYHAKEVQKEVQKVSENKRFFLYGLIAISILVFLFLIYLFRQTFKIRNRR